MSRRPPLSYRLNLCARTLRALNGWEGPAPEPSQRWPERLAEPVYALDNTVASWWQSRHNLRNLPQLTDLVALARTIRSTE
ncbi:hypothetical protein [Xanthomonas phage pXoo2107]|nr:hypothetical protein [Xanthomonas phage pXoo2107]